MVNGEIEALLRKGGWSPGDEETVATRYDPLRDPAASRHLADLLAGSVSSMSPDVIMVWEDIEDVALGFAVAMGLEIPVVRVVNADGLVEHQGRLPERPTAVLVGVAFPSAAPVLAVAALTGRQGGRLVGVASLVDLGEALPVPLHSLFRSVAQEPGQA